MQSTPIILIVDDNRQQFMVMHELLDCVNANLLHAETDEAAHALCQHSHLALILIDLDAKNIDGYALAERLKQHQASRHIPLIFLTDSMGNVGSRLHAYEVGAIDYLNKPLEPRILQSKVRAFLDLHQQREEAHLALLHSEQLHNAARESEARFRQVLIDAPIPVMLHAEDGEVLLLSKTWTTLSGYTHQDIPTITRWLEHAFGIEHVQRMQTAIQAYFHPPAFGAEGAFAIHSANGQVKTWDIRLQPLAPLADGRRIMITMALDISERKQIEQKLAEESQKNSMLLNASSDGIHILQLDGMVVQVNSAFCNLLGYSEQELLSFHSNRWQVVWSNEEFREKVLALPEHGVMLETAYLHRDGHLIDVEINAIQVQLDGKTMLYASARDISKRKQMQDTLIENEYLLQNALRISHLGTFKWNILDNSEIWSEQHFRIFGLEPSQQAPSHTTFLEALVPEDVERVELALAMAINNTRPYDIEYRIVWPNGQIRRLHAQGEVYRNESDLACLMIGTVHDITEQYRREEAQRLAITVFNTVDEGVIVTDPDHRIIAVNPAFTAITGCDISEVLGKPPTMFLADSTQAQIYQEMLTSVVTLNQWTGEITNLRKNGETYIVSLSVKAIRDELGEISHFVQVFSDITEKKKSERLIWHQANFDALTNLANRHMLQDRLQQEILKAKRDGLQLALLVIDLDRFKEINDTLGHDIGDILLMEAARRISSCVRASDTVARLGGDEFVILLAGLEELDCVERIARSLVSCLVEPFILNDEYAYISASIGIALYPNDAEEIEDLLKHADQAMYSSKNAGRNRHSYFASEMQLAAQLRRRMTNDLRGALLANQMRVHYQPIVELSTGSIHKAEALVRWQHPVRGLVSPADFIPLAEETGLINEIGDWVFRESARQVAHLQKTHNLNFQISVNKSPVQFRKDGGPTKAWFRYLNELGLTGQSMVIEITEGLLMHVEDNVTEKLLAFRDAGMQVSLDDFGTGYSSLSYLKKFDIDYLKIDKSFVSNLETDPDNLTLCESIIVMAHKLGLKVIAEGVETEAQRALLSQAGCDYAQGFYFSGPVDAEQFERFLLSWKQFCVTHNIPYIASSITSNN